MFPVARALGGYVGGAACVLSRVLHLVTANLAAITLNQFHELPGGNHVTDATGPIAQRPFLSLR
jgi:hypothetical protein